MEAPEGARAPYAYDRIADLSVLNGMLGEMFDAAVVASDAYYLNTYDRCEETIVRMVGQTLVAVCRLSDGTRRRLEVADTGQPDSDIHPRVDAIMRRIAGSQPVRERYRF